MEQYVGLDVSLKETSICVLDGSGETVWQGEVSTSVETLARSIMRKAPGAVRIGLHGSEDRGVLPVLINEEPCRTVDVEVRGHWFARRQSSQT